MILLYTVIVNAINNLLKIDTWYNEGGAVLYVSFDKKKLNEVYEYILIGFKYIIGICRWHQDKWVNI